MMSVACAIFVAYTATYVAVVRIHSVYDVINQETYTFTYFYSSSLVLLLSLGLMYPRKLGFCMLPTAYMLIGPALLNLTWIAPSTDHPRLVHIHYTVITTLEKRNVRMERFDWTAKHIGMPYSIVHTNKTVDLDFEARAVREYGVAPWNKGHMHPQYLDFMRAVYIAIRDAPLSCDWLILFEDDARPIRSNWVKHEPWLANSVDDLDVMFMDSRIGFVNTLTMGWVFSEAGCAIALNMRHKRLEWMEMFELGSVGFAKHMSKSYTRPVWSNYIAFRCNEWELRCTWAPFVRPMMDELEDTI